MGTMRGERDGIVFDPFARTRPMRSWGLAGRNDPAAVLLMHRLSLDHDRADKLAAALRRRSSPILGGLLWAQFGLGAFVVLLWNLVAVSTLAPLLGTVGVSAVYVVFHRRALKRRVKLAEHCITRPACFFCGYDLQGYREDDDEWIITCPECGGGTPRVVAALQREDTA
ncbi:MAG: hypothetical protein AAF235_00150 [Planctomycetota bacterium]